MNRLAIIAAILLAAASAHAKGASLSLTIVINGPASTSITCPITATFTAPVAAGTVICPITVAPSGWSGTLALSGTNAGSFAISSGTGGQQLVVGSAAITTAGTETLTITATP
jgi:hypothetical protein